MSWLLDGILVAGTGLMQKMELTGTCECRPRRVAIPTFWHGRVLCGVPQDRGSYPCHRNDASFHSVLSQIYKLRPNHLCPRGLWSLKENLIFIGTVLKFSDLTSFPSPVFPTGTCSFLELESESPKGQDFQPTLPASFFLIFPGREWGFTTSQLLKSFSAAYKINSDLSQVQYILSMSVFHTMNIYHLSMAWCVL